MSKIDREFRRFCVRTMPRSLPTRGSIVAAPRSKADTRLYPARVICAIPCSGDLIVKFLDENTGRTPVLIESNGDWFDGCCAPEPRKHPEYDRLVASFWAPMSGLERYRAYRAKNPRKPRLPSSPITASTDEPTFAKWRQKCTETGAMIEKGDHIVKKASGWALALSTPPISPVQATVRRSRRIQAQKAVSWILSS